MYLLPRTGAEPCRSFVAGESGTADEDLSASDLPGAGRLVHKPI